MNLERQNPKSYSRINTVVLDFGVKIKIYWDTSSVLFLAGDYDEMSELVFNANEKKKNPNLLSNMSLTLVLYFRFSRLLCLNFLVRQNKQEVKL